MQDRCQVIGKNIQSGLIVASVRNNNISIAFGWFDKLKIHRPHCLFVLLEHRFNTASTFLNVASQPPDKTDVHRNINEDFQVQQLPNHRIVQNQKPFKYHHWRRLERHGFRLAIVLSVVVLRNIGRYALSQLFKMCDQQIVFECIRMVIIDQFTI